VKRSGKLPSPVFLALVAVAIIGGFLTTLSSTAAIEGGTMLLVLGGWGVTLSLHEFSHAAVAYRGGDYSVRHKGYLNLDIRRYTDPVFSLVIPLLLLIIGGIPLPGGAVWINQHALRSRGVRSMVSLAGPLSNLVIGILLTGIIRLTTDQNTIPSYLVAALSYLALLQILAFVLNILPVPGLDGWGAIEPYLSPEAQRFGAQARPWAPLVLFVLLFASSTVSSVFFGITDHIFDAVGGNELFAGIGQNNFLFWRR
jgi:Zn-dependent protease